MKTPWLGNDCWRLASHAMRALVSWGKVLCLSHHSTPSLKLSGLCCSHCYNGCISGSDCIMLPQTGLHWTHFDALRIRLIRLWLNEYVIFLCHSLWSKSKKSQDVLWELLNCVQYIRQSSMRQRVVDNPLWCFVIFSVGGVGGGAGGWGAMMWCEHQSGSVWQHDGQALTFAAPQCVSSDYWLMYACVFTLTVVI